MDTSSDLSRLIGIAILGGVLLFVHLVLTWRVFQTERPWRTNLLYALSIVGVPIDFARRGNWVSPLLWCVLLALYIAARLYSFS